MADGRTRLVAKLSPGDRVVGTEVRGQYRRYVSTEVLAHWSTIKPAYRVTLEDGTELISSGEHRFLTNRGWKFVTGSEQGVDRRPHLTTNNELLGTGGFAGRPGGIQRLQARLPMRGSCVATGTSARRRTCALTARNGARTGSDSPSPTSRRCGARSVISSMARSTRSHRSSRSGAGAGAGPSLGRLRRTGRGRVARLEDMIRWPLSPSDDWRKGFLAGIFDAEGSCGRQPLRRSNKDRLILDWTAACLTHFRFDRVEEPPKPNGVISIRVRGGLRERLRFFHLTDPGDHCASASSRA